MTAHDPRVTLTEAERRILLMAYRDGVLDPGQAVLLEVERIIAARLAPIRAVLDACDETKTATVMISAVRAALDAPVSASQDHDGAKGQGEGVACRSCNDAGYLQGGQRDGEDCPACTDEDQR